MIESFPALHLPPAGGQTDGLGARELAELERLLKKFLDSFDRRG